MLHCWHLANPPLPLTYQRSLWMPPKASMKYRQKRVTAYHSKWGRMRCGAKQTWVITLRNSKCWILEKNKQRKSPKILIYFRSLQIAIHGGGYKPLLFQFNSGPPRTRFSFQNVKDYIFCKYLHISKLLCNK